MNKDLYNPDGNFEYDGKKIFFRIVDNADPPVKIKGKELVWRNVQYTDERGFVLFTHRIRQNLDDLVVTEEMAEAWFLGNIDKVRWDF